MNKQVQRDGEPSASATGPNQTCKIGRNHVDELVVVVHLDTNRIFGKPPSNSAQQTSSSRDRNLRHCNPSIRTCETGRIGVHEVEAEVRLDVNQVVGKPPSSAVPSRSSSGDVGAAPLPI